MAREVWLKVFLRGESPSDAIAVALEEGDATVSDLKRRFLAEVRDMLPGQTALPWIALTLPPAPFSEGLEGAQPLESSQELADLPEGAGSKKWHLHAEVRLLGDMGPPVDRTPPVVTPVSRVEGRTLYDRGMAGRDEPDHIKNAMMVAGGPQPLSVQQQIVHHQLAAQQQLAAAQQQQLVAVSQMSPQQLAAAQQQQQLVVAQQPSPDQQTQKWIEQQTSRWTEHQGLLLVEARRVEDEKYREQGYRGRSVTASDKWQSVADFLISQGVVKTREQCRQKWENLMRDFKKIKDYRTPNGHNDYWTMDAAVRKDKKLPGQFSERIYEAMEQFLCERNLPLGMRDPGLRWNPPEDGEHPPGGGGVQTPMRKRKWQVQEDGGLDEALADLIKFQAEESRKLQIELARASWEKMEKYMDASLQSGEKIIEAMNRISGVLQGRQQQQQHQQQQQQEQEQEHVEQEEEQHPPPTA